MADKNLNISVLLDHYGAMLTEKQRDFLGYYYNDDLSLSEPLLDRIYAAGGEYTQKLAQCNVYCAPEGDASTRTRTAQGKEGLEILTMEELEALLG